MFHSWGDLSQRPQGPEVGIWFFSLLCVRHVLGGCLYHCCDDGL